MKISTENIRIHSVNETKAPVATIAAPKQANSIVPKDNVLLSSEAQSLNEHAARIAELKAMVGKGENIVHPERIAKAIVSDAFAGVI